MSIKIEKSPLLRRIFILIVLMLSSVSNAGDYEEGIELFNDYYKGLEGKLKAGNHPRILGHGHVTKHAIVLVHGITDSPYYMLEVAKRFKENGLNVVLPLLDAHGLKMPGNSPKEGMGKKNIYKDWKRTVENAVEVANLLSAETVSIGGLSTGGALSVYQVLDDPSSINGGIFLFSAALDIGTLNQIAGKTIILGEIIAKNKDEEELKSNGCTTYPGEGANPYKYPIFPNQGGLRLSNMIDVINELLGEIDDSNKISIPVYAAHSTADEEANIEGIVRLLRKVDSNRAFYILSDPKIPHASVVLKEDIELTPANEVPGCMKGKQARQPSKNPHFSVMMDGALAFFQGFVDAK